MRQGRMKEGIHLGQGERQKDEQRSTPSASERALGACLGQRLETISRPKIAFNAFIVSNNVVSHLRGRNLTAILSPSLAESVSQDDFGGGDAIFEELGSSPKCAKWLYYVVTSIPNRSDEA